MPDARLLYATPTGKHPTVAYCKTVHDMALTCKSFERTAGDLIFTTGPVQMARSRIAMLAIEQGYDFVLMHDDDLAVMCKGDSGNPLDAWHELFDANPEVAAVGAVYLREKPYQPTVVVPHPKYPEESVHVVAGMPYAPVEVGGVGTGFIMIRVSALKAIDDNFSLFRFSQRTTRWGNPAEVGEDYDFCNRLRAKGLKVLADPRFPTTHMKESPLAYNWHDWEASWKNDAPDIKERAEELRGHIGPGAEMIETAGGFLAVDYTPPMIADCARREARKAA